MTWWAVLPPQILPTLVPVNYPGRGQPISFSLWILEQAVLGSCHLSYPSPWPCSNCSFEAFSHFGANHRSPSPHLCPNSLHRLHISSLPGQWSTFTTQQVPWAGVCSICHLFGSYCHVCMALLPFCKPSALQDFVYDHKQEELESMAHQVPFHSLVRCVYLFISISSCLKNSSAVR